MKSTKLIASVCLLAFGVMANAQLYGLSSSDPGTVYTLDANTGAATMVVNLNTQGSFMGLEFLGGTLYATDVLDPVSSILGFGQIDLATGAYTKIVDTGFGIRGLAADQQANLFYGANNATNQLISITPTGTITMIGFTTVSVDGFAFDNDNGILYAIDGTNLYTIDVTTAVATTVGALGIPGGFHAGLAYDDVTDTLYMNNGFNSVSTDNSLFTVNTLTGAATLVGSNGPTNGAGIDGLAFNSVPEPASMIGLALGGLALLKRKARSRNSS